MEKSIDLIQFAAQDWQLIQQEAQRMRWTNLDGDMASIQVFNTPPELPGALIEANLDLFRAKYRRLSSGIAAGIVSVDLVTLQQITAIQVIIKVPKHGTEMHYIASLTLPFADCSFVIKFECKQQVEQDYRDSTIQAIENLDENDWYRDPYDPKVSNALYTPADDAQHDELFPDHPISRARSYLASLDEQITFKPDLYQLAEFNPAPEVEEKSSPKWKFWAKG